MRQETAALREFNPGYDRNGSFASIALRTRVRLSPDFRHVRRLSDSSRCATNGLMHRSKMRVLFDHLVGAGEQHRRDGETERLGRDQVDDEVVLGRLLNRDVARLSPMQNLIDKVGGASE
jgi:hypothetical protein